MLAVAKVNARPAGLGAGGVARSIAFGLSRRGASLTISSRHDERATELAEEVGCRMVTWSQRATSIADVIVNCTNPGTWAFHCHILPHAESEHGMFGMVTALIVQK